MGIKIVRMEANYLHQIIRSARIEGALLISQQQCHKEGLEEGLIECLEKGIADTGEKFVLKLLESFSPYEISRDYDISMEMILEINIGNYCKFHYFFLFF